MTTDRHHAEEFREEGEPLLGDAEETSVVKSRIQLDRFYDYGDFPDPENERGVKCHLDDYEQVDIKP